MACDWRVNSPADRPSGVRPAPASSCPDETAWRSSLALGLGAARPRFRFEELDDGGCHIGPGRLFDALEPRRRVDLHDERTAIGLQHVDAADIETHGPGRLDCRGLFLARDGD